MKQCQVPGGGGFLFDSHCILCNKLHIELLRTVCFHETPVSPLVVDRTKAGAINSKQALHQ